MKSSPLKRPHMCLSIPSCPSLRVLPSLLLFLLSYVETKRQEGSRPWSLLLVSSLEFEGENGSSRLTATGPVAGQRFTEAFTELKDVHRKTRLVEDLAHVVLPHPLERLQGDSIAKVKVPQKDVVRYSNAYPTLERGVEAQGGAEVVNGENVAEKEDVGKRQTETGEEGEYGVLSLLEQKSEKERSNAGGQALCARPSRKDQRDEMREVSEAGGQGRGEVSLLEERAGRESLGGRLVEKAHAAESDEGRESEGNRGEEDWIEINFGEGRKEEKGKTKDRSSFVHYEQKRIKERYLEFPSREHLEKEEREGKEKGNGAESVGSGTKGKEEMYHFFIEAAATKPGGRNGKKPSTFKKKERTSEGADVDERGEGVKEEAEKDDRGNREQGNFSEIQQKIRQAGKCNDCENEKGENSEGKRQEEMRKETSFLLKGMTEELTSADTLDNGTSFSETKRRKKSSRRREAPQAATESTAEGAYSEFVPYIIKYRACDQERLHLGPTTAVVAQHAVATALHALQHMHAPDEKDRHQTITFICGAASAFGEVYHSLRTATQGLTSHIDDTGTDLPVSVWMARSLRQHAKTNRTSSLARTLQLCSEIAELTHAALGATDYLFGQNPASPVGALGNYLDGSFLIEGSTVSHGTGHDEPERRRRETAFTRLPPTTGPEVTATPPSHLEIGLQAEREPPTAEEAVETSEAQPPAASVTAKEAAEKFKGEGLERTTETMQMGELRTPAEPLEEAGASAAQAFHSHSSVNQTAAYLLSKCTREKKTSLRRGIAVFLYTLIHVMHVFMHNVRCTLQTQNSIPENERTALELTTLMLADCTQAETHFQFLEGMRHTQVLADLTGFFGVKKTHTMFLDCVTRLEQKGDWSEINETVLVKGMARKTQGFERKFS